MKKYYVTLYFHTSIDIEVKAMDRQQAIEYACNKWDGNNPQIVQNMQEDDSPDVYVWNEQLKDHQIY